MFFENDMRVLLYVLLTLIIFAKNCTEAHAFFTDDHKKNMLYGAFKNPYTTTMYLGIRTGFLVKTWTPNIVTAISPSSSAIDTYSAIIPNSLERKTRGKNAFSVGIDIGLRTTNSNFRHEINFEWYGISSKAFGLSGNSVVIDGETHEYAIIDGRKVATLGTYSDIYKLGYSLYYNFENVFNMMGTKWDVFIGGGAGLAFVDGGTYIGSEIKNETKPDIDVDIDASEYNVKNKFTRTKSFAVAYNGKIGVLSNISQSFAATVALSFGATSRPLLTTNFKTVNRVPGTRSHLEYHVAIEIGLLLKAFDFAV